MAKRKLAKLPPLWDYQKMIVNHDARFKVLAIGRRAGKSYLSKIAALDDAINNGKQVWLVFPAHSVAFDHWRQILRMVGNAPFTTYRSQANRILEFSSGGSLAVRSGDTPDNLRGSGLDLAVLDEAAFMSQAVFFDAVLPALADKQGKALLISTPNGHNWFYRQYLMGISDEHKEWMAWQMPSTVSPLITEKEFEVQRNILPDVKFRREFLAEFEGTGGGAFGDLENVCILEPLDEPLEDAEYVAGIDWGRKNDFTVLSVFDKFTGEQVFVDRFTDIGFEVQSERIMRHLAVWMPQKVFIETNNIGAVMFENLKKKVKSHFGDSLALKGVYMTNDVKRRLVEGAQLKLERGKVQLLSENTDIGMAQKAEFSAFEAAKTQSGQNVTYRAKSKSHDDMVIAAILAMSGLWVFRGLDGATGQSENPFY